MKISPKVLFEAALIAGAIVTTGCIPARPLTIEDQAERVYKDMAYINKDVHKYMKKHGPLPSISSDSTKALIIKNGYLKRFPSPPPEIFTSKPMDYELNPNYDRMDAGTDIDAAIQVGGLKDSVCIEYNSRFGSDKSGPAIYDYEKNNDRYPGEAIGREMITYAIKWKSDAVDDCEIEWVIEYR
jgi:hypothetical protein